MRRPGYSLRLALFAAGIDPDDQSTTIADLLGHTVEWVRDRISGRRPWTVSDAVKICDEFGFELDLIYELFGNNSSKRKEELHENTGNA